MTVELTDKNFNTEVLDDSGVVLVDFWAPWCGPCRMVGPIIDELASEYQGKAKIGKLNVDDNPATASKYGIMSIPTMLIFKNGEVVDQMVGVAPKAQLVDKLDEHLG
ncbi:MAG: thioredoxin TrxA [Firmicutes bacterium]|nr:thioredoxin TrxA [Bacillota bacterium]